jgi:hypothetical protein
VDDTESSDDNDIPPPVWKTIFNKYFFKDTAYKFSKIFNTLF